MFNALKSPGIVRISLKCAVVAIITPSDLTNLVPFLGTGEMAQEIRVTVPHWWHIRVIIVSCRGRGDMGLLGNQSSQNSEFQVQWETPCQSTRRSTRQEVAWHLLLTYTRTCTGEYTCTHMQATSRCHFLAGLPIKPSSRCLFSWTPMVGAALFW